MSKQQLFHEVKASGQHRLVICVGKGPAVISEWASSHDIGLFRGYYFATAMFPGGLTGVFRVSRQTYEAL